MFTIIGLAIVFAGVLVILNDMTGLGIFIIIIGCLFFRDKNPEPWYKRTSNPFSGSDSFGGYDGGFGGDCDGGGDGGGCGD